MAGLVTNDFGEILLIRSPKRGWEVPGGQVEEGEDLISALTREIWEETGVSVEVGTLVAVSSNVTNSLVVFDFICHRLSGEPTTSDESPEVRWAACEAALTLVSRPAMRARLQTLLAFNGTIVYRAYDFLGGDPLAYSVQVEQEF